MTEHETEISEIVWTFLVKPVAVALALALALAWIF